ncbi:MAG: methyltransferase domain-containing protein [Desulfovibrionaceae bacterium]
MRILLVMLEFPLWLRARHWSFVGNYAIVEALRSQGVECVCLPAYHGMDSTDKKTWLGHARELLEGQTFDQVWLWLVHNEYDPELLAFFKTLAPVRVGWLGENLLYTDHEHAMSPELHERRESFMRQVKALTHVLVAADEAETAYIGEHCGLPAIWWPTAVPLPHVFRQKESAFISQAIFCGFPYGDRKRFLQDEAVMRVLMTISPPENAFSLPDTFNDLCAASQQTLENGGPVDMAALAEFTGKLHEVRKEIFTVWQKGLARYALTVNLPSYGKCYTSRVAEAMATGRAVCAWRVPDRPRNEALFADGEDIFLYEGDDPAGFAALVTRVVNDKALLARVEENARAKILAYHTMEIRVRQVLDWIATGEEPVYSDAELARRDAARAAEGQEPDKAFYVDLFTQNAEWSSPVPNADEAARWEAIGAFLAQAAATLGARPRVLDVGCGRGWLSERIAAHGDYVGLEPVAPVAAHAARLFPGHTFLVGSFAPGQDGALGADQFDVLVSTEVIEHVCQHRQAAFARRMYERTRDGGFCIVTTPRGEVYSSWRTIVEPQPTDFWFSEEGLERLFILQGFETVAMRRVFKTMPKVYAADSVKDGFVAPDQVPLYQAWLFRKPAAEPAA